MKRFIYSMILVGSVSLLTGCGCFYGGCGGGAGYVQTSYVSSCSGCGCGGCGCSGCGYGFGYNDWY